MPDISIANNAAHVAANSEILQHLSDTFKILGPFVVTIVGLLVWAWKRLERTQDKLETAFAKHVEENDRLHDQMFNHQRMTDEKLNELLGEHRVMHGDRHP
jgi:hypothetical protein